MNQRAITAALTAPLLALACFPAFAHAESQCTPDSGMTVADTFLGSYSCNGTTAYNLDFDAGEDNAYRLQAHTAQALPGYRLTANTQTTWRFRISPPIDCTPEPADIHNTTQPAPPLGHLPNTGATIQAWAPVGVAVLAIIGAVAVLQGGRMNLKKTD